MSDAIPSDPADGLDFEAALAELETLVERMETGSMSLEESLKAFERGIKLTRTCQDALKNAELRVKALLADGSEVPLETLATDD